MDKNKYRRISIVGCCGSGKSTLAKQIGNKCNLPIVHIDQLFWLPNWTQRKQSEFVCLHNEEIVKNRWVMDGNNSSTMKDRFNAADLVIVMNYPRWLSYARLLKRIIVFHGQNRDDMALGCYERFDFQFFKYVFNFHKTTKVKIDAILNETKVRCIYLNSPQQTKQFIETLYSV